ncbi:MAG: extracellular solute-binding protein [Treponema sp.]|jgi:ABC-type glycerol-3-phosphate transport system substrate-binding protein|nr:extracellular solute-binding protein [Treponema sp.]
MKRLAVILGLLGIFTGFVSAKGSGEAAASGLTEITMQISWAEDSGRGKIIREILDAFEQENPDIKVRLLGGNQTSSRILTLVLSGQAPEILQANYQNVRGQARDEVFQDIGRDFAAEGQAFYALPWEMGRANKVQYGVPWMGHTIQLVYNEDLFAKAGLTRAPNTWDELYEYARKLTVDTNGDGKIDQWGIGLVGKQDNDIIWTVDMFMYQGGAALVDTSGPRPRVALNSPQGKRALEYYLKLIKECAPPDSGNKAGGDVMTDFRNQVVAMELQGPWGVTDIWKTRPFKVNASKVPSGPAGRFADIGLEYLTIPTGIENEKRAAAVRVIKFLASQKGQEMLMKGELGEDGKYYPFRIPIRKDMANTQYFKDNPVFQPFIDGFEFPSISAPVEAWYQVQQEVYKSELNKLVVGSQTIDAALREIERQGNAILSR